MEEKKKGFFSRLVAVSYTHLDVYKRQDYFLQPVAAASQVYAPQPVCVSGSPSQECQREN